ncbi:MULTISPECIES: prolyl aminopeptidase [unclassified Neisseria]|uniref:prolyl aminopeptidase n=1 Tax=unclassified Neisseria TaxID=2623750 RepID=UPI0026659F39|nr:MULTISPECIES: prolyl aminopeptidase [unclassified Neisseria]MDO1509074.1 prolyl aminopeptidase [Neisseria sp. MVDL19-042950]MDO1516831.1 prolyl aminopeptidase [Neisseria sp. MVDL18-041461]MDO1563957.1 prolyl aminopeptidase [Neisseria sp. MVDL20-010259]
MYPIQEPYKSGLLKVSAIHQIYWEESGNPHGIPVIFLHGGPGAGASPKARGFFNPDKYRVVIIDQRGCGRSLPYAETYENTTWDLVADIEKVREMLGIHSWLVFGGSWGSTLSLAYAQTHPNRVRGLILRGIFLGRQSEIDWLNEQGGAEHIYPEQWQHYLAPVAEEKRGAIVQAYHEMLFGQDREQALRAAKAWAEWESWLVQFDPKPVEEDAEQALAISRIENHYFVNGCWLENEKALLANVDKIRHIPTVIVQGRYDICTPMKSAWELKQAFPEADLRIVQGGHASFEGEVAKGLVRAADEFADKLAV